MNEIKGYPRYFFDGENVFRHDILEGKLICKPIAKTKTKGNSFNVKLINYDGARKTLTINKIKSLSGYGLKLPPDAVRVINSKSDYIDRNGNVYGFNHNHPSGIKKKHLIDTNGYPAACVIVNGKSKQMNIHRLLLDAFVYPGYVDDGLCCLHKDNNKLNYSLDNLEVGTYSQNNKDAYRDGLNSGNKEWVKKKHVEKFMKESEIKVNFEGLL